jgi:hypothetical protein
MENSRSEMKELDCTGGRGTLQEGLAGYGETILAAGISMVRMHGPTDEHSLRMLNKAVSSHVVHESSFGLRCRINYGMFTRYDSRFNGIENTAWEKARLCGKEAVLAASGRAGKVVAGV